MSSNEPDDASLGIELVSASQETSVPKTPEMESWIQLQKDCYPLFPDIDQETQNVSVLETLNTLNISNALCKSSFESAVKSLGPDCDKDSLLDESLVQIITALIEFQKKGVSQISDESTKAEDMHASTLSRKESLQKGKSIWGFLKFPTQRETSESDFLNSSEYKSSFERLPLTCHEEIEELMGNPSKLDAEGTVKKVMMCYYSMCNKRNVTPIDNLLSASTQFNKNLSIELNCSGNALRKSHTQIIQRVLSICPHIEHISLNNCSLSLKSFAHLAHDIRNYCKEIKSLSIKKNNELCGMGMKHLQPILSSSHLERLDLSSIQFKITGMLYLSLSVNIAKNLVHLILDDCDLSESTLGVLALQIKLKPPKRVSLRNNNLGVVSAPLIACILDSDFSTEQNLEELNLSDNNLGSSIEIICTSLKKNRYLKYLNLSRNGSINAQNLHKLSSALIENQNLSELHLSGTTLEIQALDTSLSDIIKFNTSLKSLYIDNTGIKSSELSQIARAITVNETIEYLDLSSNSFTLPPLVELEKCIEINKSLERIQILPNNNEDFLKYSIKTATILSCIEEHLERNRRSNTNVSDAK